MMYMNDSQRITVILKIQRRGKGICVGCGSRYIIKEILNPLCTTCHLKSLEYRRKYYADNLEREREKRRIYRLANLEETRKRERISQHKYSLANRETLRKRRRKYYLANLERERSRARERHRAKKNKV